MKDSVAGTQDCFEIVAGLNQSVREHTDTYYVVGGLASAALAHPGTRFDIGQRTIIPPEDLTLPSARENGTLRDIDVLVLSPEEKKIDDVQNSVQSVVGDNLEISVFGIDSHEMYAEESRHWSRNFKEFLSQRTVDEQGRHRYVLRPIEQTVSEESYEPWAMLIPSDDYIQVMHPVAQLMCYKMRSISGLRSKDAQKVENIAGNILTIPEFQTELEYGVYKEWQIFANAVERIRKSKLKELASGYPDTPKVDLFLAQIKGKLLHMLESNERIVTIGLNPRVQKMLRTFTRTA